jgi:hypothetical protein
MHRHRDDKKRNFNDIYPVHRQIHIQEPDFQLLTRIRRSQPKASFSKGANTVPATPNRAKNNATPKVSTEALYRHRRKSGNPLI